MSKKRNKRRKPQAQTQQQSRRGVSPMIRIAGTVGFLLVAMGIIAALTVGTISY